MTAAQTATRGERWSAAISPDPENREKDDFYPTDPEAVRLLLSVEDFDGTIWEPACGDGAISRVLIEAGLDVYSSDLVDRGYGEARRDFLLLDGGRANHVITNPPFKLAMPFIYRALEVTDGKVFMLLRAAFICGQKRREMFNSTPIARIIPCSERLAIWRNGKPPPGKEGKGGLIDFAWFGWFHGHVGPPTVHWP